MSQEIFDSTPAENVKFGEKTMKVKSDQTRSPLPLFITSHSLQHTSKLQTPADSWWMYLTLSDSPPHLTRNVAKFHLLHPSPGSSTGPMCLKLPRCRARSQPVRGSCGCWGKTTTLIPQLKQLQHRQQPISQREFMNSSLAWKSPSFGFDFRAAPRQGYKFLPTKIFSQVLLTFLCNMAPVGRLQCQILVSRAPAPSTAAARSTEAPEMPWQRWIGPIHRPKVTTSWRQELNIFYGQPVQPCVQ